MADSNLPVVNAIEELKADGAKQRKALQDSLGRRFRILSGEVATLSQTLATSFKVQSDASQLNSELLTKLSYSADTQADVAERQLAFQQDQATAAEFRDAENRAELARSLSNLQQQPQQQDDKKEDDKKKGIFGNLLSGIGGIVGGLGFGGLLAGAGILMAGGGFFLKELNDLDGKAIRENVGELIGIKDDFGGVGGFFLTGGTFALTMAGIGAGLAIFGAGSAVAGLGSALANFTNPNWAQSISDNVVTLLGISDRVGGNLSFLAEGGAFGLAMTGLGIGLGVFGLGAGIGGLGNALANFTDQNWAQSIVDNVATLLSISQIPEVQNAGFLGTGFAGIMTEVATGLAVFGLGAGIAGLATGLANFTTGGFAQSIRDNVATLLSISQIPEVKDAGILGTGFAGIMTEIALGLAVFGASSGIAGIGDALNRFTGGGDFAERIKSQVGTLLSILDMNEGNTLQKAKDFNATLGEISTGLVKFTGTKVFDSLASIGTGLINFFTGNEAPMTQVLKFAENQDKLESASNSLSRITDALERMSGLNKIGIDFDIEDFSEELEDAVDNIADIDQATYDIFAKRMQQLREAITPTQVLTGAEVDARSREVTSAGMSPTVNVTAPQTNMTSDNSTRINRTTVASASPRRNARSPQSRDVFADPQAMVF